MRIVIDVDGDQVRVHRVVGGELPPADVLEKATALNAESAGIAMLPGGVAALAAIGAEATDAGRAPAGGAGKAPRAAGSRPPSRRRTVSKASASRRGKR